MALSKYSVLQVRKPTIFSMVLSLVAINTLIMGVLLLALCFLSFFTSRHDPWLPYALLGSFGLIITGYYASVRMRRKRK